MERLCRDRESTHRTVRVCRHVRGLHYTKTNFYLLLSVSRKSYFCPTIGQPDWHRLLTRSLLTSSYHSWFLPIVTFVRWNDDILIFTDHSTMLNSNITCHRTLKLTFRHTSFSPSDLDNYRWPLTDKPFRTITPLLIDWFRTSITIVLRYW